MYFDCSRLCTLISGGSKRGHFRHMPFLVWPLIRITLVACMTVYKLAAKGVVRKNGRIIFPRASAQIFHHEPPSTYSGQMATPQYIDAHPTWLYV